MPTIAQRLADGDAEATRQVRKRVRRILAFRGYGIPPEDRRDLEQETMRQLWQAVSRPDFAPEGFWGFVERVVSCRCIDWLRTRRVEEELGAAPGVLDGRPDPLTGFMRRERVALAEAALARLPRDCRRLIRLHVVEENSYREIARILDVNEGALRVRMHRCIRSAAGIVRKLVESKKNL